MLSLLCLEKEPRDRSEELDTHGRAQPSFCRREVWGPHLKAKLQTSLQVFRQLLRQTCYLQGRRGIEQGMKGSMSQVKRDQSVNDLIEQVGEGQRCGLD